MWKFTECYGDTGWDNIEIFLLDENLKLNIFSAHYTTRDLVTGGVMSWYLLPLPCLCLQLDRDKAVQWQQH